MEVNMLRNDLAELLCFFLPQSARAILRNWSGDYGLGLNGMCSPKLQVQNFKSFANLSGSLQGLLVW